VNPSGTPDLVISVGGDLSSLESAFDQIPQLAEAALGNVQSAVNGLTLNPNQEGINAATGSLGELGEAASGLTGDISSAAFALEAGSAAMTQAEGAASALGADLEDVAAAASSAAGDFSDVDSALDSTADGMSTAADAASALDDSWSGLDDTAAAAEASTAEFSDSLESLADAADSSSFSDISESLENIESSMTAGGESAGELATDWTDLGDAAEAMESDFSDIGDALSTADAAMSTAADSASELATDWSDLADAGSSISTEGVTASLDALGEAATANATDLEAMGAALTGTESDMTAAASVAEETAAAWAAIGEDAGTATTALDDITTAAEPAAAALEALGSSTGGSGAWEEIASGATEASTALEGVEAPASAAEAALSALGEATETVSQAADAGTSDIEELPPALEQTGEGAEQAESGLAAMAEQLLALGEALVVTETLKEFGSEALQAASAEQSTTLALQALGSSAEQASESVEGLVQMSMQIPVATEDLLQAQTRMQAVGIPLAQISTLMTDVAASSATMGTNINRATMMVDNMVDSGTVAATTLTRLGIQTQTFVDALNTVAGQGTADLTNFAAAFKQLDQTQAIQVVEAAMQGLANNIQAQAQTINGQLQILQNSWEAVMVGIGNSIAPTTGAIVTSLTSIIQTIEGAIAEFQKLPAPIVAIGTVAAQLTAALGVLAIGFGALAIAAGGATLAMTALGSAAVVGPWLAVSGAVTGATVAVGEFVTGLTVASGAITVTAAAGATFGVALAAIAGWQLGKVISGWIDNLDGYTAAQQQATAATAAAAAQQQQSTAAYQTGMTADEAFVQSLTALGVGLDQISAKGTTARVAVQSFSNAAQEASTDIANTVTNAGNASQLLGAYAAEINTVGINQTNLGAAVTLYNAALQQSVKDQEAANGGLISASNAALVAQNAFSQLQVSVANTQQNFAAVSAGFANGTASLSQYTAALKAMNTAQEDANNGIEQAGTALLLAENDFRLLGVAATNSATALAAVVTAVDAGDASWTQYDAALQQLNKDQMALSGGLQDAAIAEALLEAAFENLGIAVVNANTNVEAATAGLEAGTIGFQQYATVVNNAATAEEKFGNGLLSMNTAIAQAGVNSQQAVIGLANLNTQIQAAYQQWLNTGQGLQQYLDLLQKLPAAAAAAQNGLLTVSQANQIINGQQQTLQNNLANDTLLMNQLGQAAATNANFAGQYAAAQQKVAQDTAALTGAQATATTAINNQNTAQKDLNTTMQQTGTVTQATATIVQNAWTQATAAVSNGLSYVNGQFVDLAQVANASQGPLSLVNGAMVDLTAAGNNAAGGLSLINGQFISLGKNAPGAVTALDNVAAAASNVTSASQTAAAAATKVVDAFSQLTDTLGPAGFDSGINTLSADLNKMDTAAVDAFDSLNGATTSVQTTANELFNTAPQGIFPEGGITGPLPPGATNDPFLTNQQILNSTATIGPGGSSGGLTGAVTAATTAITANTTAVTASTAATTTALTAQQAAAAVTAILTSGLTLSEQSLAALNLAYSQAFGATTDNTTATDANTQATDANTAATAATTDSTSDLIGSQTELGNIAQSTGVAMSAIPGVSEAVAQAMQEVGGTFTIVNGNIEGTSSQLEELNDILNGNSTATGENTTAAAALASATTGATTALQALGVATDTATTYMNAQGQQISEAEYNQDQAANQQEAANNLASISPSQAALDAALTAIFPGAIAAFGTAPNPVTGASTYEPVYPDETAAPILTGGWQGPTGMPTPANLATIPQSTVPTGSTTTSSTQIGSQLQPTPSINVNVNAGTVVGANGMQQLASMVGNQLVKNLGQMGIKLNRQ
jgi:trimeric autotransporter adhesin